MLQGKYVSSGRGWNTDKYWHVPLNENIQCDERLKVACLKWENLPIPAEFH